MKFLIQKVSEVFEFVAQKQYSPAIISDIVAAYTGEYENAANDELDTICMSFAEEEDDEAIINSTEYQETQEDYLIFQLLANKLICMINQVDVAFDMNEFFMNYNEFTMSEHMACSNITYSDASHELFDQLCESI